MRVISRRSGSKKQSVRQSSNAKQDRPYDIALSFAGEDRAYVKQVAEGLRSKGVRVFFDLFEEADLWGKDLYRHLQNVYQRGAHYTVIFVSQAYVSKLWPRHERQSAQARAFEERSEYILPARFDDADLPGLPATIGYVDLRNKKPHKLVDLIIEKLRVSGFSVEPTPHTTVRHGDVLDDAHVSVSLQIGPRKDQREIAIRVDAYSTIGQLLDDIFIHYLAETVQPFTYGQSWVLTAGFSNYQWLLPWEWVWSPGQPVHEIAPEWQRNSLAQLSVAAGSHWHAIPLDGRAATEWNRKPDLHVLACNDPNLAVVLRNNPKAYALLDKHDGDLRRLDPEVFRADEYRYTHVFRDWLRRGLSGAVLVQSEPDVCAHINQFFSYINGK